MKVICIVSEHDMHESLFFRKLERVFKQRFSADSFILPNRQYSIGKNEEFAEAEGAEKGRFAACADCKN